MSGPHFDLSSITEALAPVAKEYRGCVRAIALEILEDERATLEDFAEVLHEQVDGSWWVIYTYAAQAVLMVSENDGAAAEELGTDGVVSDGALDWSKMAYWAMEADVREEVERLSDPSNHPMRPDPDEPELCAFCGELAEDHADHKEPTP